MTDPQLEHLERSLEKLEKDLNIRLDGFSDSIRAMTNSVSDLRSALLGDLGGAQNSGLIADHRQLKAEFAQFRADLIRWKNEAAEPAIKDLFRLKIQIATIVSVIMVVWTVVIKFIWK